MRVWGAAVVVGAGLMAASPAGASVARVQHHGAVIGPHGMVVVGPSDTLDYLAGAGESNGLSVVSGPSGLLVTDTGANVQAQAGCTQLDQHSARCGAGYADVRTGDGDDHVVVRGVPGRFSLGAGADKLTVDAATSSTVSAGSGNDAVAAHGDIGGGEGDDSLTGGPDHDLFRPGPGRDTVTGGDGQDEVTYEHLAERLRIDLAAQRVIGSGGKDDRLTGIEDAVGGSRADAIIGSAGPNELD